MVDSGVNPYIVDRSGKTQMDFHSLYHLTIPVEMTESVYFSIYPNSNYPIELQKAWFYTEGTFPTEIGQFIGKGSEGYVISGVWNGFYAAYKFVEIKNQKFSEMVADGLNDLRKRLTEFNALKAVQGSHILQGYGHFR